MKPSSIEMQAAKMYHGALAVGAGGFIYGESAGLASEWLDEYQRDTEHEFDLNPDDNVVGAELQMIEAVRRYFNVCAEVEAQRTSEGLTRP
jgi:hypothetical protein